MPPVRTTATLLDRAAEVLPGGVSSNVRLAHADVVFDRGEGCHLWDSNGRHYIDYLLGQGPAFLGHGEPRVNAAVAEAVQHGMVYGATHRLEIEATEALLGAIGWADQARLCVSGTEADHGAVRLARGATGATRLVRFTGSYHGWLNDMLADYSQRPPTVASRGQLPDSFDHTDFVPFNDLPAVAAALSRGDVAAVIVEPIMCNNGVLVPKEGFLAGLRALCDEHGALLIFDEVITGFRLALGGAVERFGVTPDLAVYGKALAGGWPVAAIAGRRDLMSLIGTNTVNHSGTFNASVMAAAAVKATIEVLRDDDPYNALEGTGQRLQRGLAGAAADLGVPMRVAGVSAAFHVGFADPATEVSTFDHVARLDLARYAAFASVLAEHGIWVAGRGIWYVSTSVTDNDVAETIDRFHAALSQEVRSRG